MPTTKFQLYQNIYALVYAPVLIDTPCKLCNGSGQILCESQYDNCVECNGTGLSKTWSKPRWTLLSTPRSIIEVITRVSSVGELTEYRLLSRDETFTESDLFDTLESAEAECSKRNFILWN